MRHYLALTNLTNHKLPPHYLQPLTSQNTSLSSLTTMKLARRLQVATKHETTGYLHNNTFEPLLLHSQNETSLHPAPLTSKPPQARTSNRRSQTRTTTTLDFVNHASVITIDAKPSLLR